MQLKSFAVFSASALVSNSPGALCVCELFELPITKNDVEIIMLVKILLRLCIFLGLSSSSRFRLIKLFLLSLKKSLNPRDEKYLEIDRLYLFRLILDFDTNFLFFGRQIKDL